MNHLHSQESYLKTVKRWQACNTEYKMSLKLQRVLCSRRLTVDEFNALDEIFPNILYFEYQMYWVFLLIFEI